MSIYKNSIGVPTSIMSTNTIYTIQVNATDGNYVGYLNTQYQTEPDISIEFVVEPSSGIALITPFMYIVTS